MRRIRVAFALLATSCTDLGGLSSGSAPTARDAGAGTSEGGVVEAGAGTDAGGCTVTFCDDFERTSLQGKWDELSGLPLAPSLDGAQSFSPTRSLHVVAPQAAADGSVSSVLRKAFPAKKIHLHAMVRFDALPSREIHVFEVSFFDASVQTNVFVNIYSGVARLAEQQQTGATYHDVTLGVPATGWQPWDVTVDAEAGQVEVSLAGATASYTLKNAIPKGSATVQLGVEYARQGTQVEYWVDDVAIDVTPP